LDEAQEGFGAGDVGEAHFSVLSGQFQPVTVCHQLTALLVQPLFQLVPILSGSLEIGLLSQHLNDVHDGKEPGFGLLIVDAANCRVVQTRRAEVSWKLLDLGRDVRSRRRMPRLSQSVVSIFEGLPGQGVIREL